MLAEIHRRPACFERETTAELWTDEHVSARMLALHLDGTLDVASRKTAFIERSVAWLTSRFALGAGRSVADFGCGPGLYTTRLAASGTAVTGIDFSERSIGHARKLAASRGLSIRHVHGDYLAFASDERFDLITLIMCDFCALGPARRRALLEVFQRQLRQGGALLLDVYSLAAFAAREERAVCAANLDDGFWSAQPYFGFSNTFKYEAERVVLDKYTIVEEARTRVVYNWLQHFDRQTLQREIEAQGLLVEEFLGDVAGAPFDPAAHEFAVLARKPA